MDRNLKSVAACIAERSDIVSSVEAQSEAIGKVVDAVISSIRGGGRIYFFGNGGSAAQAQHFAAELSGRFLRERPAWGASSLTVDTSALTAIANDYGFEHVFARQLEGLVERGDVAVGLTTSGKSPNVVAGLRTAREKGALAVAITGSDGGPAAQIADITVLGPAGPSWKIQEAHLTIGHILCELVELGLTQS